MSKRSSPRSSAALDPTVSANAAPCSSIQIPDGNADAPFAVVNCVVTETSSHAKGLDLSNHLVQTRNRTTELCSLKSCANSWAYRQHLTTNPTLCARVSTWPEIDSDSNRVLDRNTIYTCCVTANSISNLLTNISTQTLCHRVTGTQFTRAGSSWTSQLGILL